MLTKSAYFPGPAEPAFPRAPSSSPGTGIESLRCHVLQKVAGALQEASHGATNIQAVVASVEIAREQITELFGDFGALVDALVDSLVLTMLSPLQECESEEDFVRRLTAFGRRITDPYGLVQQRNLYRIALTEAIRDAGRGQDLYARGPGRVLNGLTRFLADSRNAGVLLQGESRQLASHLLALLKGCSGLDDSFPPEEWKDSRPSRHVASVIGQFLAGVQLEMRHANPAF